MNKTEEIIDIKGNIHSVSLEDTYVIGFTTKFSHWAGGYSGY